MTTQNIYACRFEGARYDTGDKLGYLAATVEYALRHETLSPSFARYLAAVSLDKNLPVHEAIAANSKGERPCRRPVHEHAFHQCAHPLATGKSFPAASALRTS